MRTFEYENHLKLLKINVKNQQGDMTSGVFKCYKKPKRMLRTALWQKAGNFMSSGHFYRNIQKIDSMYMQIEDTELYF